jgi:leucyl aminopeptidase
MLDQPIDCVTTEGPNARPLYAVRPDGIAALREALSEPQAGYLADVGFQGATGELALLPGPQGLGAAVLGLGEDTSPFPFGALPSRLPEGSTWALQSGAFDQDAAVLGFCLGAYRYSAFKPADRAPAKLLLDGPYAASLSQAAAAWMVRDLINTPANLLGPAELAGVAADLGRRHGAAVTVTEGEAVDEAYPTIAAVGRGSVRPPLVTTFHWRGSAAPDDAPLVSLCGKGVVFDTGGYDLKPSAGMLKMKKDMGGAATILGLARLIMEADLPVRLAVRVGCVENSVSGSAMRPMDVLRTRSGRTVEVGNTDAEGRLVLCDLLDEACTEAPSVLIDCATLTGAARVALGPDLPALFSNDDAWAEGMLRCSNAVHDAVWRLPLWSGYAPWLKSSIADINNVSSRPFAGAIVAALFLQRFVSPGTNWLHLDVYAWNDQTTPGRPEGGEAMAMRALFAGLKDRFE